MCVVAKIVQIGKRITQSKPFSLTIFDVSRAMVTVVYNLPKHAAANRYLWCTCIYLPC